MVKVTVGEMSYEGTAEEIKELFEVLGAEFPNSTEATEGTDEEVSEDLPVGTKIKVKTDGRLMTLSERKPKHDGVGFGKAYGLKGKSTWLGEEQFEVVEGSGEVTKTSFQEGDIAVVTGRTRFGDIPKGSKVRVRHSVLDADGEIEVVFLDESDYDWVKPEALELVVDEEETTLKNGDKVRLLHGGNEGSAQGFYNGKIYEVVDVNWIVRDGEHRVCIGEVGGTNEGYVDIEQLEKVEETTVEDLLSEAEAKFPEGAKVRIVVPEDENTSYGRAGVTNNMVGTVKYVRDYGIRTVKVDFGKTHDHWTGLPEELEVVTEEDEEIEVGDIIRRDGKLHEVEGVREPGYVCSGEGLTTTDGRWMFIETVELVAKKSDRKDV